MADTTRKQDDIILAKDPLWYKDAIIYQLHVRAFRDSNEDGIGDFRGLTEKLDYLQDLGVTALWLLPFYVSPLRDDGYDIADYTAVHPNYGTLQDFKTFLTEAHRRGLRVITELVVNHTSDQHAWFQRARRAAPGTSERDFYVWNQAPEKYQDARIIFKDYELSNWSWDPLAKAYYWHRFYSHQPDLNFDNPDVVKALFEVLDFWLEMGIDGLRLDAVPYLYEREGTNCENLPETHAFLKRLRSYVDEKYPGRMLLAEANQWPEDAAAYFGNGDECNMAFHFPVMPRIFMAVHMEDNYPIIDILDQTPAIPENSQWAIFLRNHDELTLEMVTDEDRDYMYKVYATDPQARINLGIRRRLAPLLWNNRRKIELLNCLLMSLPGTPIIYYGDEIGMGDNIYLGDRNGVRTPMQWSADRNAGFSRANPQRLYLPVIVDAEYHYEAVNVEAQQQNLHSLLWWTKRLLQLRKTFHAFGRGSIQFFNPDNRKVLVFIRRCGDEMILVVANLSRFVQYVELDFSLYKGMIPVELFSRSPFPSIGELPYFFTLGPHAFYWFKLEPPRPTAAAAPKPGALPKLEISEAWDAVFQGRGRAGLEAVLPDYLQKCRWFGGKAKQVRAAKILDATRVPYDDGAAYLLFAEVQYSGGLPETYLVPVAFAPGDRAAEIAQTNASSVIAQLRIQDGDHSSDGILFDALADGRFCKSLLQAIARGQTFRGEKGEIVGEASKHFQTIAGSSEAPLEPAAVKREQSNSSIVFGDRLILKVFRRLVEGSNPDLEIGKFLTEKNNFAHVPPFAGAMECRSERREPMTLAILQGYVQNQGDAWGYTLDSLQRYLETCLARRADGPYLPLPRDHVIDLIDRQIPPLAHEMIGAYLPSAELLGRRTGEMHVALALDGADPAFAPEGFSSFYRRSMYEGMRTLAKQTFGVLARRVKQLPEELQPEAKRLLDQEKEIYRRLRAILDLKITGQRTRHHGDYHLGQLLYTGKDFVITDFEGEPARALSERRTKRSALKDIAGMIRSFNYAAVTALRSGAIRADDAPALEPWSRFWNLWVSVVYVRSYLQVAGQAAFLPRSKEEMKVLLDLFILEKAVYEIGYELNNRPDWVRVPIRGILEIIEPSR
ncbi:MAG TPA: maltose alpha-D-glucosyltransferase [Verrucomicrobiae bacterium]|jgi:maltose alpha-D-glucosyltransferase/alpha-amylase|nr:maltose alpha-D-glucosyltransferase [Verrucomicrobiae bacterium]